VFSWENTLQAYKKLAYICPIFKSDNYLPKSFCERVLQREMIDTIYPPMRREDIFRVYRSYLEKDYKKEENEREKNS